MSTTRVFDWRQIEVLSFDCYGTLIDWEAGILAGLRRALGDVAGDDELLEAYARAEASAEAGPYRSYRTVLAESLAAVGREFGITPTDEQVSDFAASVVNWPAFPDSVDALARLRTRFRLAVITNCDDDLFDASNKRLGEPFSWIVTAQQVGSYKPALRNFDAALERIGAPREVVLHVAQSLFHDHVPAQSIGLATAWIDRRRGSSGFGATPVAVATPSLACPDMATFADMAVGR